MHVNTLFFTRTSHTHVDTRTRTRLHRSIENNDMHAAMHQAMRPTTANAAARDVMVRSVEQGSHLLTAPRDRVQVIMQVCDVCVCVHVCIFSWSTFDHGCTSHGPRD
jgi:hypothetical protein